LDKRRRTEKAKARKGKKKRDVNLLFIFPSFDMGGFIGGSAIAPFCMKKGYFKNKQKTIQILCDYFNRYLI
jgi:hypothetical protein